MSTGTTKHGGSSGISKRREREPLIHFVEKFKVLKILKLEVIRLTAIAKY